MHNIRIFLPCLVFTVLISQMDCTFGAEMKTKSLIKNMFFLKKNEASQFLGQTRNKRGLHEECVNEGCTLEEVLEVHEWMRKLPVPAGGTAIPQGSPSTPFTPFT